MSTILERLARMAARRPALTLGVVLALALGGAGLALRLHPNTGTDTFVSRSSASFHATDVDQRDFGGDPVIVLIREPLPDLVQTTDLARVTQLEACLAGQVVVANQQLQSFTPAPAGSQPPYGGWHSACGKLMKDRPVQVVYGPGTFLNRAVAAVNQQIRMLQTAAQQSVTAAERDAYRLALGKGMSRQQAVAEAKSAGQLETEQQANQLITDYFESGITGTPRIDDPQFVPQIVFDQARGTDQPKARFAYLFPTANSALIQVRLKASLSDAQRAQAISWIRQAVNMPMFRSTYGGTYTVTGVPVVLDGLASAITGSIAGLLIAAVLVMAATLLIVFRSRLRLLPLAVALAAAGITFGGVSLIGASLTMASIAVLPILIGLAVDYTIQFQSRAEEARRAEEHGAPSAAEAVARAAVIGAPTIVIAALATATGFLVLLLSPVPMVRGFGLLLVVGIAIALACALLAGSAAMVLSERRDSARLGDARGAQLLGSSLRGAAEIVGDGWGRVRVWAMPVGRWVAARIRRVPVLPGSGERGPPVSARRDRLLSWLVDRPGRVVAVAAVLAVVGWVADTQTSVQSDVTKLVPSSMPALRDLRTLERVTGMSGEIDVVVHSSNVATPRTIGWMLDYENTLLAHYGYLETQGCARATLCPALSLPDLFSAGTSSAQGTTGSLTASSINSLLAAVPAYFKQAVITPDRHEAALAFGIRLMPLARQQQVINYMRGQLHPPAGVSAQLAGIPVLAAEANTALSSSPRRLLTLLAGLIAVGAVLLAVFRRPRRALVPLVPIALATGWSALILFLIGIPLNPMSATLGTLVIAISTEFSVLLSERFRQEREAGYRLHDALKRTYGSTGAAVLASGITAIAGFGVLIFSSITMLRDFGLVTLIDLSVSLAGVLVVLPAVLALAERGDIRERALEFARRTAGTLPRPRRRPRVA
jgi:hydrophobe/amphiphile efflux-3 (HAE3) family protein